MAKLKIEMSATTDYKEKLANARDKKGIIVIPAFDGKMPTEEARKIHIKMKNSNITKEEIRGE